jgi:hypothetical protein
MGRTRTGGIIAKRREEWRERLARFQASGLTVRAFAAQEGVRPATVTWWRRKLEHQSAAPTSPGVAFVALTPVERKASASSTVPFEVALAGASVRVWPRFDAAELARLLQVLKVAG